MSEMVEEALETREAAFARIPTDQRFTWVLKPLPGRLLFAETIGASLVCMKDMFASLTPNGEVVVVLNCGFRDDGAFLADLAILPDASLHEGEAPAVNPSRRDNPRL